MKFLGTYLRSQLGAITCQIALQVKDKGAKDVIDEVEAAVCEAVITIIDGEAPSHEFM